MNLHEIPLFWYPIAVIFCALSYALGVWFGKKHSTLATSKSTTILTLVSATVCVISIIGFLSGTIYGRTWPWEKYAPQDNDLALILFHLSIPGLEEILFATLATTLLSGLSWGWAIKQQFAMKRGRQI